MNIDQELLICEALRDRYVFDTGLRRLEKQLDILAYANKGYQFHTAEAEAVVNLRSFIKTVEALYEFAKEKRGDQ